MVDKYSVNKESYRTPEAVEKYSSNYYLFPIEAYLVSKYYKNGDSVLDLACGAGRTTLILHEKGFSVKGVDLSDVLIATAKKRFPYLSLDIGSFSDINASDKAYDHVLISHNGLDYAYPEEDRVGAIKECLRVLRPGGTFIYSSHNIKSILMSPYYLFSVQRSVWRIKNIINYFKESNYIFDLAHHTFFASPEYIIKQTEKEGFKFIEMIGFQLSRNKHFNKYVSPYIHYVFKKST